jgi:hypothetical protein
MGPRRGWLAQRLRGRVRRPVEPERPPELVEIIKRLDRLLYLTENERRAVDEALSAILERLRLLEARVGADESVRETSTTNH